MLSSLKHSDRTFETFYLPALEQLIRTFERVCLWCDAQTAEFLSERGLDKKIQMRVMDFSELPHYVNRDEWLHVLKSMQGRRGFLLQKKTPEQWLDYMIVIHAKTSIIKWAAENNHFKSDYFMWLDGGALNGGYWRFWDGWTGAVDAMPTKCRFSIGQTIGKTRPHFVPRFLYQLYRRLFVPRVTDATTNTLIKQDFESIAMINSDYEVPACSFIIPINLADKFYENFETVRKIMQRHGLLATEQAVFQAMMKCDVNNMFELVYTDGYRGVYAAVAKKNPDYVL